MKPIKNLLKAHSEFNDDQMMVIKLVKAVVSHKKIDKSDLCRINWAKTYKELKLHAVAALFCDVLNEYKNYMPETLYKEWVDYITQQIVYTEQVKYQQNVLTRLMMTKGIKIAVLKGFSAAYDYDVPYYRNMGDIDFLVNLSDFNEAYTILRENGYSVIDDKSVDYHVSFLKGNVRVELHREPAGIADGEKGDSIRRFFANACDDAELIRLEGESFFYKLPRLHNGMVLLLHVVKHLDGGLGLRQILDWMMFVKKELSDETWEREFKNVLTQNGLADLAKTVTLMCKIYLGLPQEIKWCNDADPCVCTYLMHYVMDSGNFGCKDENAIRTIALVGRFKKQNEKKKLISTFQYLTEAANKNLMNSKCRLFVLFGWLYLPLRFIVRIFKGERKCRDVIQLIKIARNKKRLFELLRIYKA